MKSIAWRSIALSSALIISVAADGRPRYGGALRVQTLELPNFETSPMTAEALIRIDERGDVQPMLARTWQRDADGRRWRFTLRAKVVMHDGAALTPALAASMLGEKASVAGQQVVVVAENRTPPMKALVRRGDDGSLIGTGPFRLTKLEPGKSAVLTAFRDHWAGRPFLDSIELSTQRGVTADVLELPVTVSRRSVPERYRIWTAPPRDLIVWVGPAAAGEVLSLAVDRESIANVITQRRGVPARGLLPEWLSGYAAALPGEYDLARAKQIVAEAKPGPVGFTSPADPLLRLVADRIALNARDAGLALTVSPQASGAKLLRLRLSSNNAALSLAEFARALGVTVPSESGLPQALFDAEKAILAESRIVPIVFIPEVYGVDPRVRNWDPAHLETVWVSR